jgi:hypothetical protein
MILQDEVASARASGMTGTTVNLTMGSLDDEDLSGDLVDGRD